MTFRHRHPVRAVTDRVLITDDAAWAAWQIPLRSYLLLSDGGKKAVRDRFAAGLAAVRDGEAHLRLTPTLYDVDRWQQDLRDATPRPAPGFDRYLERQHRYLSRRKMWRKAVTLYVRLGDRGPQDLTRRLTRDVKARLGLLSPVVADSEVDQWVAKAARIATDLEHGGVAARPLTARQIMEEIGATAVRGLDRDVTPVRRRRYGHGEVLALPVGEYVEHPRHLEQTHPAPNLLRWLTIDTVPVDLPFPGGEWLMLQGLAFPVEVSIRLRMEPAHRVTKDAVKLLRGTQEQREDSRATGNDVPAGLDDAHQELRSIERQVTRSRQPVVSDARVRFGLWAGTVEELDARTDLLVSHFRDLGMTVHAPSGDQALLHLEAAPGGRVHRTAGFRAAYEHRMPTRTLAGGMLHADTELGDRSGWYVGDTRDGKPVHFDPLHAAQVRDDPTGIEFTGLPGQGKSTAMFLLGIQAAYRGWAGLVVDPSNRAGAIAGLEGIGDVRVRELGPADAGCLDPFHLAADDDAATPADLALSTCQMLLPASLARDGEVLIQQACHLTAQKGGDANLHAVIAALKANGDPRARQAAEALAAASSSAVGRLFFATRHSAPLTPTQTMTVLQVRGLDVPAGDVPRGDYTAADRAASTAMFLIAQYARRLVTALPLDVPKIVLLDELHGIAGTPWGNRMVSQLVRDGRKHNAAVGLASQTSRDFGGDAIEANIGARFAFRADLDEEVRAVLRAHNLEPTTGNMQRVRELPKGACLFSDGYRTDVLRWNRLLPEIAAALDTTAPGRKAAA